MTYRNYRTGEFVDTPGIVNRKGDMRAQKLKVACVSCNTGWMSQLQQRTKPILLPLLLGQRVIVSRKQQSVLAAWVTMYAMVCEFAFPETVAIPQSERDVFMKGHCALRPWRIWAAPYGENTFVGRHFGVRLSDGRRQTAATNYLNAGMNLQLTMTGFGRVCFAALSTTAQDIFNLRSQLVYAIIRKAGFVRIGFPIVKSATPSQFIAISRRKRFPPAPCTATTSCEC